MTDLEVFEMHDYTVVISIGGSEYTKTVSAPNDISAINQAKQLVMDNDVTSLSCTIVEGG